MTIKSFSILLDDGFYKVVENDSFIEITSQLDKTYVFSKALIKNIYEVMKLG